MLEFNPYLLGDLDTQFKVILPFLLGKILGRSVNQGSYLQAPQWTVSKDTVPGARHPRAKLQSSSAGCGGRTRAGDKRKDRGRRAQARRRGQRGDGKNHPLSPSHQAPRVDKASLSLDGRSLKWLLRVPHVAGGSHGAQKPTASRSANHLSIRMCRVLPGPQSQRGAGTEWGWPHLKA